MGSSPTNSFMCRVCKKDGRLEKSWEHHITSLGHQRILARLPQGGCGGWEEGFERKERAVEIVGCKELKASPYDVAEYLTRNGGTLEEFICPTSNEGTKPNVISCLFKRVDSVRKLVDEMKDHKIFRHPVQIKRKFNLGGSTEKDVEENWEENNDSDGLQSSKNGCASELSQEGGLGMGVQIEKREYLPFERQLLDLHKYHKSELRLKVAKELQKIIVSTFNSCAVYSYGTDALGVSLDSDEIRFCIDPYGKFTSKTILVRNPGDPMVCGLIFQILSTSKQSDGSPLFKFVSQYSASSVDNIPEMSFKYNVDDKLVPCRFQFENFLSVQKSRILKFLSSHDVRVHTLFSLLRLWTVKHKVFSEQLEGEEFEGFLIITLMVFHLIRVKIIPPVMQLRELGKSKSVLLDNMDISFCFDRKKVPSVWDPSIEDKGERAKSVLTILAEFFKFFGNLDFTNIVVCSSIGAILKRHLFNLKSEHGLPEQFDFSKTCLYTADGSKIDNNLNTHTPVVVQDFLNLTDNIGRAVDTEELSHFQSCCLKTSDYLERVVQRGKGSLERSFSLLPEYKNDEEEISEDEEDVPKEPDIEIPEPEHPSAPEIPFSSPAADFPMTESESPADHCIDQGTPPAPKTPSPPPLALPPLPFQLPGLPPLQISMPSLPLPSRKRSLMPMPTPPPPPRIGILRNPRDEEESVWSRPNNSCPSPWSKNDHRPFDNDGPPSKWKFPNSYSSPAPSPASSTRVVERILRDPHGDSGGSPAGSVGPGTSDGNPMNMNARPGFRGRGGGGFGRGRGGRGRGRGGGPGGPPFPQNDAGTSNGKAQRESW